MNSNPTFKQQASPAAILVAQMVNDWKSDEDSDSDENSGPPNTALQPEGVNVNHRSLLKKVNVNQNSQPLCQIDVQNNMVVTTVQVDRSTQADIASTYTQVEMTDMSTQADMVSPNIKGKDQIIAILQEDIAWYSAMLEIRDTSLAKQGDRFRKLQRNLDYLEESVEYVFKT